MGGISAGEDDIQAQGRRVDNEESRLGRDFAPGDRARFRVAGRELAPRGEPYDGQLRESAGGVANCEGIDAHGSPQHQRARDGAHVERRLVEGHGPEAPAGVEERAIYGGGAGGGGGERKDAQIGGGGREIGRIEAGRENAHQPRRSHDYGCRDGGEDPGEDAQEATEKGEPRVPASRGQHGDKGEHDAVDDHRIQRIDGAHGDGQRIGAGMCAQQVRRQRHAQEAQQIAGDEAGHNHQPAAHERAFHRAVQNPLGAQCRGWFGRAHGLLGSSRSNRRRPLPMVTALNAHWSRDQRERPVHSLRNVPTLVQAVAANAFRAACSAAS